MSLALLVAALLADRGEAAAQDTSAPSARARAAAALARVDLSSCTEHAAWAARRVEVGLVVFPDGAYGVALGTVTPELVRDERAGLAGCIEVALRAQLGDVVPLAPRAGLTVTRTLEVPGSEALAAAVAPLLDASRTTFERCVRERAVPTLTRIEVVARVEVRDGRVVAVGSRSEDDALARVAACVQHAVRDASGLPDGAAVVTSTVTRPPARAGRHPRADGTEGAVCRWGSASLPNPLEPALPRPSDCREGLRCCSPGSPASDSTCRRVGRSGCPRLP